MIAPELLNLATLPSFPLSQRNALPSIAGIYFAIDSADRIQYIGRSVNIRGRWAFGHHRRPELENLESVRIAWLEVEDLTLLKAIERKLISHFKPCLNGVKIQVVKEKESKELVKEVLRTNVDRLTALQIEVAILQQKTEALQKKLPKKSEVIFFQASCDFLDWIKSQVRGCESPSQAVERILIEFMPLDVGLTTKTKAIPRKRFLTEEDYRVNGEERCRRDIEEFTHSKGLAYCAKSDLHSEIDYDHATQKWRQILFDGNNNVVKAEIYDSPFQAKRDRSFYPENSEVYNGVRV